jgi:hypothetical protein
MPRYELAPVRHVAQRDESGQSRQVAELPGRDDPPQVSLRHAQIASDLGDNWLGGVDDRDRHRADSGEQRPSGRGQPHAPPLISSKLQLI